MRKIIFIWIGIALLILSSSQVLGDNPDNLVGYEYLSDGNVLHIWNTQDDYYFNTTNGMQFSNHFNEYWSKNIFCGGLKGLGLYCTDTLDFLEWVVSSDNQTYVNYIGTKTFDVGNNEITLQLIYYLGVDDTSLTVQPKIFKGSRVAINKDVLFVWKVEDIQSGNTQEDDVIHIENLTSGQFDTYDLSDNLDVTYTDSSQYVIDDITGLGSIKLQWNPEEIETLTIQSEQDQHNAPITLTVNMGEFSQDVITTAFQWIDADCTVFCINPDDEVTGVNINCPSGCSWDVLTGQNVGCMAESIIGTCSLSSGCKLEWEDNTGGSYAIIPATDTDVDCSGSTCRKTAPNDNTWHYKNISCEDQGSQQLRCTLNIVPEAVSVTPTLTCNAVTINTFNNSLTAENLTFTGNENITRYLDIHKDANVTTGVMDLTGLSLEEYQIDENTAALWHLDEGSGNTTYDETGINNGTFVGSPLWNSETPLEDSTFSLNFSGSTDYVNVPYSDSLNITGDITVEAWIKPDNPTASAVQPIISKWDDIGAGINERSYILYLENNGKAVFEKSYNGAYEGVTGKATGTTTLVNGTWYHIAGTFNSSSKEIKIYVNDILETTTISSYSTIYGGSEPVFISSARAGGGSQQYFDGLVDEVRISNAVRTQFGIVKRFPSYPYLEIGTPDSTREWAISGELHGKEGFLDHLNDSSLTKDLTFTYDSLQETTNVENNTVYISIPKNADIINAHLNLVGFISQWQENIIPNEWWYNNTVNGPGNAVDGDIYTYAQASSNPFNPICWWGSDVKCGEIYENYTKPIGAYVAPGNIGIKIRQKFWCSSTHPYIKFSVYSACSGGSFSSDYKHDCSDGAGTRFATWYIYGVACDPLTIKTYLSYYQGHYTRLYESAVYWYNETTLGKYPTNLTLDTGNDSTIDWNYTGEFNTTEENIDINTTAINSFLSTCIPDSNGFCQVPLLFHSDTAGIIEISNINITYTNISTTSDFSDRLNSIIPTCNCSDCHLNGDICSIPFLFHSDTAGVLEYSALKVTYT